MATVGTHAAHQGGPTVVRTHPSLGAVITPGRLKLSVTFDRPMLSGNYSFVRKDVATFPKCDSGVPEQSADGRTFTLSCKVEPGRYYEVWFNSQPYMNFKALDGAPAVPFQLKFKTKTR